MLGVQGSVTQGSPCMCTPPLPSSAGALTPGMAAWASAQCSEVSAHMSALREQEYRKKEIGNLFNKMQKYSSAGSHEAGSQRPNVPSNSLIKKRNMTIWHPIAQVPLQWCHPRTNQVVWEVVVGFSGYLISVHTMQMFKYCWSLLQAPSLEIRGGASGAV